MVKNQADHRAGRFLFTGITLVLGAVAAWFLWPAERVLVEKYLNSYPEAHLPYHHLRPVFLLFICFLPAVGGLVYAFSQTLDRYLYRKFFNAFLMSFLGFFLIWLFLDLENNLEDFTEKNGKLSVIFQFYLVQIPYVMVLIGPFVLLLSSLFVLGKLSTHRELISMIQTGRGLARVVRPLFIIAVFLSVFIGLLNFHWAPWGESYKEGLKDSVKYDSLTLARNVVSYNPSTQRFWFVGLFPQDYYEGEPLKNVEITFPTERGVPEKRLRVKEASWDKVSGDWTFYGISELLLAGKEVPEFLPEQEKKVYKGWAETPSLLVAQGLKAEELGIPELSDWLKQERGKDWADTLPFRTQWHYRISKPWGCLVAVLLATPLGVVFSRRGAVGGVLVAIILCILLFVSNEIFIAMGEGGYLSPWLSAWGANLLFACIGGILLFRRMQNRPIYQSIRGFFSTLLGKG